MRDVKQLVENLQVSTLEWVEAVQQIPDTLFNTSEEGRWSAGQIFMHLILSEKGINSVLMGPSVAAESNRAPLFERMERGFTNYERKLSAPAFLEPRSDNYDKHRLLQKFVESRNALVEIIENSPELDNLFTTFAHPYFGLLTGYEWAHNVWLHANRHFRQLKQLTETAASQRNAG